MIIVTTKHKQYQGALLNVDRQMFEITAFGDTKQQYLAGKYRGTIMVKTTAVLEGDIMVSMDWDDHIVFPMVISMTHIQNDAPRLEVEW